MAQAIPYVLLAASVGSTLQAGKAEARGYAAQATMQRMQAKTEELRYKEQGVAVLDNILRTQASITARAAAGGIDPFSGSAKALNQYAMAKGAQELYTTQESGIIALRTGEMRAGISMTQAKSAMSAARARAFTQVAGFAAGQQQLGWPSSSGSTGLQSGQSATTARAGFRGYGG
jgi:hypothetical protein